MEKKMLVIVLLAIMWLSTGALAQQKDFTLTKQGVGPIKKGMSFTQIPAKHEGLYTHFKKTDVEDEMDGNYTDYIFYNGTSKVMEIAQYSGDTTVSGITCFSPRIKAANGMYAGMPSIELYNRKAKIDYEVQPLYLIGDYQFTTPLSATGKKKIGNLYLTGKAGVAAASDFPKDAKITEMSLYFY